MRKILVTMITLLLIFISSQNIYAKSFKYDSISFDVRVNKNGSVDVTESNTYNFRGSHNGVLRDIDVDDLGAITVKEIYSTSSKNNEKIIYKKTNDNNLGDYNLNIENNLAKLKIYSPSKNEVKTFTYNYNLDNAIIKYNDIGQLNWKIFDSIDKEVKSVSIKLSFEQVSKKEDLRIFVHGPLWGNSIINNDGTIDIKVDNVPKNTIIEINSLFPTQYVPNAKKIYNQNNLDNILKLEEELADHANAYREEAREELKKREASSSKNIGIAVIAIIVSVICFFILYIKFDKELPTNFKDKYFEDLPADYSPAVLSYLINETRLNDKELLPTLLNLVLKEYLRLEFFEEVKMIFYKTNKSSDDLPKHEKFLIDWLIDDLGECFSFDTLNDIQKDNEKIKAFSQKYNDWKALVNLESAQYNFFESKDKSALCCLCIFAVSIIISIVGYKFTHLEGFFMFSVMGFFILVYNFIIIKKTPKGQADYTKWMALKKILQDSNLMSEQNLKSITVWERFIVYGITLGVSKQLVENIPKILENNIEYNDSRIFRTNPLHYIIMFKIFNNNIDSIETSINDVFQTMSSNSSSEGFGGGFSGGSSGGSGGSGGRGAF